MKIIQMQATFGKLEGDTLWLEPGMNEITAPNEWGKSTWCAFLTAMLYGIETRARSTKDTLADKEHYAPWSGRPMEGRLRLEHQGRDITIARRTKGRVPLGDFVAFETHSGLPIPELTAENCGERLLGVERSVFLRSGFITLKDMPVTQDEALRRRLSSLVTTADESGAADRLAAKLKELRNRCRYHKTGLIPQSRERLEELNAQLDQRRGLEARLEQAGAKEARLEARLQELERHQRFSDYEQARQDAGELSKAVQAHETARAALERQRKVCAGCLSREELEARLVMQEGVQGKKKPGWLWIWLAVALFAGAGALAWFGEWMYAGFTLIPAAVLLVLGIFIQVTCHRWEQAQKARMQQREHWLAQLRHWNDLDRLTREAEQLKGHVRTLRALIRPEKKPEGEDPLTLSQEETKQALSQARQELRALRQNRGQILGRMEGLPSMEALTRQTESERQRLRELERVYTALGYAQKALEDAMAQLQQRFAPRILRRAEEHLKRLTRGRYARMGLDLDLNMTAEAQGETAGRTGLWRSDGTADQMYLALRLAVWEALAPDAPLVLDDALVRFDAQRLNSAMALLRELAETRQVIVFSCR